MSVRRGAALTVSFAAVDVELRPQRKGGTPWSGGDVLVSKDGSPFANAANLPSEIGSTGRYALTLTAAEMDAAWLHVVVERDGIDPVDLLIGTAGNPSGTVFADAGNTASQFKTDRTEGTTDHWKDCLLLFTSGALAGQVKRSPASTD
ncbi:MAG TPA: hypothetical protein VFQ79_04475 [Bryobacteraceae bacterium]|nr:hypothetical protein [Bryobacteraceae bacterium]